MENNQNENSKDSSLEVVKSFLTQFSNNQNHHQTLFIQFLSSVIIVLTGYAFVYSNTSGHNNNLINKKNTDITITAAELSEVKDDSSVILKPIYARKFESIKSKTGSILSYGLIHLIIIYLFAQTVMVLLGLLILHMGYSYRRDQVVVNKMRKDYLNETQYDIYFSGYSGLNKKIYNYLPNFNSILFGGIFLLQILLYLSIYIFLNQFTQDETFLSGFFNQDINYLQAKISVAFPLAISLLFYSLYFIKYNKKINNLNHYRHISIINISNKKNLFFIANISFFFFITLIYLWLNTNNVSIFSIGVISLANAIGCYFSSYLQISSSTEPTKKNQLIFKFVAHGFIFLIAAALIIISVFIPFNFRVFHHLNLEWTKAIILFMFLTCQLLLYFLKYDYLIKDFEKEIRVMIRKQITIESNFLILVLGFLVIDNIMNFKLFDKLAAFITGILSLVWGIRRVGAGLNIVFKRGEKEN